MFEFISGVILSIGIIMLVGLLKAHVKNGWGEPVATGTFENSREVQQVDFGNTLLAWFVSVVSVAEVNNRKWTVITELDFY